MLYVLLSLISFAALIGIIAAYTYRGSSTYHSPGVKKITMDHVFNGTFSPITKGLRWVPEGKCIALLSCLELMPC
jgi:dipeptidyl aminopeptidase